MNICDDCKHVFEAENEVAGVTLVFYDCPFCGSQKVRQAGDVLRKTRVMGPITDPSDRQPTKHQRLKEGFAMLRGAEL